MDQEIKQIIFNNNTIQDQITANKVELALQKLNNVTIPSIILEYISCDNLDFELDDLKQFYHHFGEVLNIVINGKQNIVLFKTFFSANICKIFLENKDYYRENMKQNFIVRWFDFNKDSNILPLEVKDIFQHINDKNIKQNILNSKVLNNISNNNINNNNIGINMNLNMPMNNNINGNVNPLTLNQNVIDINQNLPYLQNNSMFNINNNFSPPGIGVLPNYNDINPIQNQQIPINMLLNQNNPNINNFNNYNNNIGVMNNINQLNNLNLNNINGINNLNSLNNINNLNLNNINNLNNMNNINMNNINNMLINQNNKVMNKNKNQFMRLNGDIGEEKNTGKYTCKYEILIENDSEFQIARRLIGSKGCNMKKIINECKSGEDEEGVKLRLRGRGSGYKEGPENKESDEPLHLCISSKNTEKMKKACLLVDELLEKIHQDYKEFCEKNNIVPVCTDIATRVENKNIFFRAK